MAKMRRIDEVTPNGGAYSEIHYFDNDGICVDESIATRCAIRECSEDGKLIAETWGTCNNDR